MNILFLLAGRASRFREAGYNVPKALIEVKGKLMIQWAVDSLNFIKNPRRFFVCLREHDTSHHIVKYLRKLYGTSAHIILANDVTEGAAVSALLAKDFINNNDELIISNADQFFASSAFEKELAKKRKQYAGLIPIFEATHSRWSFAKLNNSGFVTEVAEKVPISNHATVGVYYFRRGSDFVWAAEEMIRKDIRRNNEFFVCPVFNELLGRGERIKAVPADVMWSMGTPEDLIYFDKYYKGDA
jgi:choline kinase